MTEYERPTESIRPGFSRKDWDDRYAKTEFLWSAEPNRHFAAEIADLSPGRALDIACGEGRNAVWLAESGWAMTAVDFSPVALAKGEQLAATRGVTVDWVLDDVVAYRPPSGAFDLVALLYLQLPADELTAVLGAAVAGLAPDGTLLVLGHDTTNLTDGYGGPKDATVLFTTTDIAPSLGELVIERAEQVTRTVARNDGERLAIDAFVRARRPVLDT